MQYQIMKNLKFDEFKTLQELSDMFPRANKEKLFAAMELLALDGFLVHDSKNRISLRTFSSFYEYKCGLRKTTFEFIVSLAAIVMAITEVLELWQ